MPPLRKIGSSFAKQAELLERWWQSGIPLVGAMEVVVEKVDDRGLTLTAPLAPNRNHMGTAFGGSLQALATLAGWGIARLLLGEHDDGRVVIRSANMSFRTPATGRLRAFCAWPDQDQVGRFRKGLDHRKRGRLDLRIVVTSEDFPVASCEACFVGLAGDQPGTSEDGSDLV